MSCLQFVWVRVWKSLQVKGVPIFMGVPSEECLGPPPSCPVPVLSPLPCPAGCSPAEGVGVGFGSSSQERSSSKFPQLGSSSLALKEPGGNVFGHVRGVLAFLPPSFPPRSPRSGGGHLPWGWKD